MADWLRVGTPEILVRLRRDRRARRFVLRVGASEGAPVLTLPAAASTADVQRFAREHEGWLREKMQARPGPTALSEGALLPVEGRLVTLGLAPALGFDPSAGTLNLPGPASRLPGQAAGFLRTFARDACAAAASRHASALGRRHGRITLRDTRSRWGSCTSRGDLMFSWRLAMAPRDVLDYVVAHEVAHLVEMNHSPRFWSVVRQLLPEHGRARTWLRENGAGLHRYDFKAVRTDSA